MRMFGWMALVGALAAAAPAAADVIDAQATGFKVEEKAEIAAPAASVWAALLAPARWWSPDHTWSHDARNLSLEARPGGCFCETLPDGGAMRHMFVVYVAPNQQLVLEGAMGPMLYSGTINHLVWALSEANGKTTVTEALYGGGYWPGGYQTLAPVVDKVSALQLGRLKAFVETGKPTP